MAQTSAGGAYTALHGSLINPARIAQQSKLTAYASRLPRSDLYTDSIWNTTSSTLSSIWRADIAWDMGKGHAIALGFQQVFLSTPSPEEGWIYSFDEVEDWKGGLAYRYRNQQGLAMGLSINGFYNRFTNAIRNPWVVVSSSNWGQGVTMSLGIHKITSRKDKPNGWAGWEYGFSLSDVGGKYLLNGGNPLFQARLQRLANLSGGLSFQRHLELRSEKHSLDLIANYELTKPLDNNGNAILDRLLNSFSDDPNELKTMRHQLGLQAWLTLGQLRLGSVSVLLFDPLGEYSFSGPFSSYRSSSTARLHAANSLFVGLNAYLFNLSYESLGGPEGNSYWSFGLGLRLEKNSDE
jgi:hypothetical protein